MKNWKNCFFVCFMVIIIFALFACDDDGDNEDNSKNKFVGTWNTENNNVGVDGQHIITGNEIIYKYQLDSNLKNQLKGTFTFNNTEFKIIWFYNWSENNQWIEREDTIPATYNYNFVDSVTIEMKMVELNGDSVERNVDIWRKLIE